MRRRDLMSMLLFLVGVLAVGILALFLLQGRMIYLARGYDRATLAAVPPWVVELRSETREGAQYSYYVPPPAGGPAIPSRVWVVFGGNASLALHWLGLVALWRGPGTGFLLVEYPGYGRSEGTPSPASILAATEAAVEGLAGRLAIPRAELDRRLGLLGHSLGAAAALQFAARVPVERLILVSPFTSMRAMARRVVGMPLALLLTHTFDNEARLEELARRPTPPRVTVIHGDADDVIPVTMGRQIARRFPALVTYIEIRAGDHNALLETQEELIGRALAE